MDFQNEFRKFVSEHFNGGVVLRSDPATLVLKAHLLVESLLDKFLEVFIPDKDIYEKIRLTFNKKWQLVKSKDLLPLDLLEAIKRLNEIRNQFVHNIDTSFANVDISSFVELCEAKLKDDVVWIATASDKKARFGICIHYMLGAASAFISKIKVPGIGEGDR